jgi:hypothetical protein
MKPICYVNCSELFDLLAITLPPKYSHFYLACFLQVKRQNNNKNQARALHLFFCALFCGPTFNLLYLAAMLIHDWT